MSETIPTQPVVADGGGAVSSGSVFALKYARRAHPDVRVVVVERGRRVGRGLPPMAPASRIIFWNAVPVSRMELRLSPAFGDWLTQSS